MEPENVCVLRQFWNAVVQIYVDKDTSIRIDRENYDLLLSLHHYITIKATEYIFRSALQRMNQSLQTSCAA
jgi:hypothetical protein